MSTNTAIRVVAGKAPGGARDSLAPHGPGWTALEVEVPLQPTSLEAQPSAYVQTAWANRTWGVTPSVRVAASVTAGLLRVRLRWAALNPRNAITDNNIFADACAVMFPFDGRDAELATMGDEARPVRAWHWRAGTPEPFVLKATGLGTTERQPAADWLTVDPAWSAGEWAVVFTAELRATSEWLQAGATVPMALATWQGAAEERGGLASHTPSWLSLELPG